MASDMWVRMKGDAAGPRAQWHLVAGEDAYATMTVCKDRWPKARSDRSYQRPAASLCVVCARSAPDQLPA